MMWLGIPWAATRNAVDSRYTARGELRWSREANGKSITELPETSTTKDIGDSRDAIAEVTSSQVYINGASRRALSNN